MLRATTACTFSTSQLPKGVRDMVCFVQAFDFEMCFAPQRRALFRHRNFQKWSERCVCFVHFDFEMCFAPQRRALFRHLNFQKWSYTEVFWTFWLRNVLRATTACNFSSLISPDVSAPAALASLLFDPPEPQIIGKTQCFATFLPFHASASSFFLLFFLLIFLFSLPLPCSAFHLSILSEVWLLNFLRLQSKLVCQRKYCSEKVVNWIPHGFNPIQYIVERGWQIWSLIPWLQWVKVTMPINAFLAEDGKFDPSWR